ncbi:hypothetical protein [Alkalihalobacillus sp. AL-G]|uniref:hypothetical protein n=1 Tax=Alkalihalobacillus sp. AL-G TaxID=2926399 RepID=UPI00272CA0C0|nr:hypothetical protein [Alkalihalobacillus sp. AL-G]WLD92498.1 hypothetical protein MOJ78_15980 [Alkalihalobacillus sp. AL-G]
MRTSKSWILPVFFFVISILLAGKGLELRSLRTDVDGTGMGVYFLFIEINDSVPEKNIPSYAFGFFISSLISLLISFGLYLSTCIKSNKIKNLM